MPWFLAIEGVEVCKPENCLLESFNRLDDHLNLFFKNGSKVAICAKDLKEGAREIDSIEKKLNEFLGKSYREILEYNF